MAAFKIFQMSLLALRLADAFGGHILSMNKVWTHTSLNNVLYICIHAFGSRSISLHMYFQVLRAKRSSHGKIHEFEMTNMIKVLFSSLPKLKTFQDFRHIVSFDTCIKH